MFSDWQCIDRLIYRAKYRPIYRTKIGSFIRQSDRVYEGTFTEPLPLGDGNFIEPTGKSFRVLMSTFGRWEDGEMVEEWLFWDNQEFSRQMGLSN